MTIIKEIKIVGAGPVGQVLAWILAGDPHLRVSLSGKKEHLLTVALEGVTRGLAAVFHPDVLVISTKAFDVEAVLAQHLSSSVRLVVICSNGDLEALLAPWQQGFPHVAFQRHIVTFGTKITSEGLWVSPSGHCLISAASSRQDWQELVLALPRFSAVANIREMEREKWWLNTSLNSCLVACGLVRNGSAEGEWGLLRELAHEAYQLGFALSGPWPRSEEALWQWLQSIVRETAANNNSTAWDFIRGRPTELSFLAGLSHHFPGKFPRLEAIARWAN